MKKAIILVGAPASGKTTYAKAILSYEDCVILCRDDIRVELLKNDHQNGVFCPDVSLWKQWKFTKENESKVTMIFNEILDKIMSNDINFIIADTNINKKFRNQLIDKLNENQYEVELVVFNPTKEQLYKNNLKRLNVVGEDIIDRMYDSLNAQIENKSLTNYNLGQVTLNDATSSKFKVNINKEKGTLTHAKNW